MKYLISLFLLTFNFSYGSEFEGVWRFTSYLYQEHVIPAPNPNLFMTFEFKSDGTNILYYKRSDEVGFCERTAEYSISEEGMLFQRVIQTNPDNASMCSSDSDMIEGKESFSHVYIKDENLYLEVPLAEEAMYFIWTKHNVEKK